MLSPAKSFTIHVRTSPVALRPPELDTLYNLFALMRLMQSSGQQLA